MFLLCFIRSPVYLTQRPSRGSALMAKLANGVSGDSGNFKRKHFFPMENYQYWMLTIAKVKRLSKPSCVGLWLPLQTQTQRSLLAPQDSHSLTPISHNATSFPHSYSGSRHALLFLPSQFPVSISGLRPPPGVAHHFEDFIKVASCFPLPLSELIYSPGWGIRHPPSAVPSLWWSALSFTTQLIKRQVCLHCLPFSRFLLPCSIRAQFPRGTIVYFFWPHRSIFKCPLLMNLLEKNQTFKKKLIIEEKNIRATLRKERASMQNKRLAEACRDGYSHLPTWITDFSCTFNLARPNVRKAGHGIWKTISSAWEKKSEILKSPIVLLGNSFSSQVIIYLGNF